MKKIPVKTTSKPPIKTTSKASSSHSSSTLKKEDIEKLFRELIRKEFTRLGIYLEEELDTTQKTKNEDISSTAVNIDEDDYMDIVDLVRLENAKDLLAIKGRVEGSDVQILADTCANLSWIPKSLAEELGMDIDASKTYKVNGVSGEERSLGIVRDGLIELQTGCTIKEDLAVVNYKHREIGLSRPCLRSYNYDVHESREHIALTCNEKNFFIPIVPDINRSIEEEDEN